MKRFAIGALCTLALAACENQVNGTLVVQKPLTVNVKSGLSKKPVTLAKGQYGLNVKTDAFATRFNISGNGQTVAFAISDVADLRSKYQEGKIYLHGAQIKQPFDLDLKLDVKVIRESGRYSKNETCVRGQYTEPYTYCHPERRVCRSYRNDECAYYDYIPGYCETRYRTVTDYGTRRVTGFDRTSQRKAVLKFIQNGSVAAIMSDAAEAPQVNFVQTDSSGCY